MGEARRKRRMVQKAERRVEEVRQKRQELDEKQEENWKELEKLREEFSNISSEYQEKLWALCNVSGPEFFPRDSRQVARLYLDSGLFDRPLGENVPEDIERKIFPRLAYMLEEYLHDKTGRLSQGLEIIREAAAADGDKLSHEWNLEYVKALFGTIYAKRMIHEKSAKAAGHFVPFTKLDWKKHMLPSETVKYGKKTINEFMHAHEEGLTGRALTAKRAVDELPVQGRKEIEESLLLDQDGDFKALREAVEPVFSKEYPSIEPDKRSEAFMALFEMTANWMQEGWMKAGRILDVDAVSYIAAENIFLEGYKRYAEKEGLAEKKTPFQIFEERLKAQEFALTGDAAEARDHFLSLPPEEQQSILKFVDSAPKNVRDSFTMAIDEYLIRQKKERGSITLQLLFDALLPVITKSAGFGRYREDLFPALTYVLSEKVLRQGFLEDQEEKAGLSPSELWQDSDLTHAGRTLWEMTYKVGGDDHDVVRESRKAAENWGNVAVTNGVLVNESRIAVAEAVFGFTAKWAVHAFQRITTTHTYAAALMCTDTGKDVLQDIEMQWHAFMVCLPNGLLKYYDEDLKIESEYSRILVASFSHGASLILLNQNGGTSKNRLVVQVASTIANVLDVGPEVDQPVHSTEDVSTKTQDKVRRVFTLAKRLVTGLLLALQHQNNFKSRLSPARDGKKPREREEPQHRVVFIGSPLKVDCRPQVTDYINNGSHKRKGAPPAVQLLVRGHNKRQVVGVGRQGRKVIWVEPYWRGPEDAPILTRPKKLG